MSALNDFFTRAQIHLDLFNTWAEQLTLTANADHLGYKCANANEFEMYRELFEKESEYIYQSIISQRRIAIIKLINPLQSRLGDISYIELSDQKPDNSQKSGFDHLEIYPTQGTVEQLAESIRLQNGGVFSKAERPHHITYDLKLADGFKMRLEAEPLIEKIIKEEIR